MLVKDCKINYTSELIVYTIPYEMERKFDSNNQTLILNHGMEDEFVISIKSFSIYGRPKNMYIRIISYNKTAFDLEMPKMPINNCKGSVDEFFQETLPMLQKILPFKWVLL